MSNIQLDIPSLVYTSTLIMFIAGLVTFIGCFVLAAPYGRFSTGGWGVLIPARLAWFLMESPTLWTTGIIASLAWLKADRLSTVSGIGNRLDDIANCLLMGLFLTHYVNRSIIYPLRMTAHSAPMPISVMMAAFFFCTWNGSNQASYLILVREYPKDWVFHPQFLIGVVIFFVGLAMNISADNTLMRLKTDLQQSSNSNSKQPKRYGIPKGGTFELVSCANFLGEIIEWWGFALACDSLTAASFAFYTMVFLTSRALHYHKWYKEKFDDYPPQRKAIYPYLL